MTSSEFWKGKRIKIHKFWLIGYNSVETIEKACPIQCFKRQFYHFQVKEYDKKHRPRRGLAFPLMNTRINDNCKITN